MFQKKCIRECMAEADQECHLLVIKKKPLEDLLEQYQDIKNQMISIAAEKRKYHKRLIHELLRKHKMYDNGGGESPLISQKKKENDWQKYKSLVKSFPIFY